MMTRISRLFALSFVVLFATALGFATTRQAPVQAQDDMMTYTCDSTLILLLYIAEHDYGFTSMMDVSTFEKGQYAPWFEMMMAEMEEMTEEEMMEAEMTEEAMMDDTMMDDMMVLMPAVIEGEDEACTALRAEIEAYLYKTISEEMMMMEDEG
jgi:hypothetical protein